MSDRVSKRKASQSTDERSLTFWRSKLVEAENFGHLNGSHKEAVIMIQNDDYAGITNLLRQIPSLSRWEDYDGRTLLAKAVFSKIILSDKLFLALIASGCDAGVILGSDIPIIQHAIIAGLSSLIILSMIAQPGNTIVFKKVSKSGTLIKAKNNFGLPILHQWTYGKEFAKAIYEASTGGKNDRGAQAAAQKLLDEHAHARKDAELKYTYTPEKLGDVAELQKKRKLVVACESGANKSTEE